MTTTFEPVPPRTSDRWSLVCICVGVSGLLALVIVEIVMARIEPGYRLLPAPLHIVVYAGLVAMVVTAVILRVVGARLDAGERRLARLLDVRYAEGYTDGMTGRPAAPVMQLSRGEKVRS